jgi:hypothetical protein
MGEILPNGYQSFRDFVNSSTVTPNPWGYIEIYDDTGKAVTRASISDDPRCEWIDADGDAVLKVIFDVTASDDDIPIPVTIVSSALWNAGSGGSQQTQKERMADATFNQTGDSVNITHTVRIPESD